MKCVAKRSVELADLDRQALEQLTRSGVHPVRKVNRARILLHAHEGMTDQEIADHLGVGTTTVERTRQDFAARGVLAVDRRPQPQRPQKRRLDGVAEAHLVTLACSKPPQGHARWSLQLLADRMVELKFVDEPVSDETVRRTLKKTRSSLG